MKKYFLLLVAAIIIIMEPLSAFADQTYSMPPIEDKEVELTIYFYVQHNGIEVPISDAEIAVYKTADISCEGGGAEYTLLPDYWSLRKMRDEKDVTFDGITATQSAELAEKLSQLTETFEQSAVTGADGKCTFFGLSQGMYLVREINAEGEAAKYDTIAPYLISLPLGIKSDDGNYWKYDVLSEPKTKVKRNNDSDSDISSDSDSDFDTDSDNEKNYDSDKTTVNRNDPQPDTPVYQYSENNTPISFFNIEKVKTGVVTNVMLLFAILFLSSLIIALTVRRKKSDDKDKRDN